MLPLNVENCFKFLIENKNVRLSKFIYINVAGISPYSLLRESGFKLVFRNRKRSDDIIGRKHFKFLSDEY